MSQHLTGYVYFVYARQVERVKIGYSGRHPDGRLTTLRNGSPVALERLGFVRGDCHTEADWHYRFKDVHFFGEWFDATPELLDAVRREAEPWTPLVARLREWGDLPLRDPARLPTRLVSGGGGKKSSVWRRTGTGGAWYTTLRGQQIWLAAPEASQNQAERALLAYARETGCVSKIIL